jgi:integrase
LEALDIPSEHRLSRSGVTEGLNRIGSFFRWCVQEHLLDRNPAEGLQALLVSDDDEDEEEPTVQAWTMEELHALLDPANLRTFMDGHRHARGAASKQRWTYFPWLLVLATYTGARMEELGGLAVDEVLESHAESEGRTPVLAIQPNAHRKLKTEHAKRTIPIHPDLERLGLWDLLRHRRDDIRADRLLWPPRRGKRLAGKATDDFKEYSESLGFYQPRVKVFHSFRHTFKTRARGVMEDGALNSVAGHRASDSTGGVYEHRLQTPRHEHLAQLSRLSFGLDLDGLADLLKDCRSVAPVTVAFTRRPRAASKRGTEHGVVQRASP